MTRQELLNKMIQIATVAHAGQFDEGGAPYILHPLQVMQNLNTDNEELRCIAIGHDVIEDTDVTYDDLKAAGMTSRIIEGIRALTKPPGQTYDEYKERVFANVDAMQVKMADLLHNTDVRRLKGVTEKDIAQMAKYHLFYMELKTRLEAY